VHPQKKEYWGKHQPHRREELLRRGQKSGRDLLFRLLRQNKGKSRSYAYSSTYGPRMRPEERARGRSLLSRRFREGILRRTGAGSDKVVLHIEDMIEGMIRMMDYETGTGETRRVRIIARPSLSGFRDPINLGNHEEVSMWSARREEFIRLARSDSQNYLRRAPRG